MAIIATEGTKFTPAPAGVHQAVCVDVIDMGVLEVTYAGETKKKHKVRVAWQIDALMEDGKTPFLAQKRYTLSLHEKAGLRKDLESWRGRAFTAEELKGFDLEKLLGANCQLNIVHEAKNGTVYANIMAVMPLGKNMPKMSAINYVRHKDRPTAEQNPPDDGSPAVTDDDIPF